MSHVGKELERQHNVSDELAIKEVENYVERVERQTERYVPAPNDASTQTSQQQPSIQTQPKQAGDSAVVSRPQITLPLGQEAILFGLKRRVTDGFRWAAEWCVMMIKKYPGRVFYSPSSQT